MSSLACPPENAKSPLFLTGFPFPLTMRGGLRPRVSKPLAKDGNSRSTCQPLFDSLVPEG